MRGIGGVGMRWWRIVTDRLLRKYASCRHALKSHPSSRSRGNSPRRHFASGGLRGHIPCLRSLPPLEWLRLSWFPSNGGKLLLSPRGIGEGRKPSRLHWWRTRLRRHFVTPLDTSLEAWFMWGLFSWRFAVMTRQGHVRPPRRCVVHHVCPALRVFQGTWQRLVWRRRMW